MSGPTIRIFCKECREQLMVYRKRGKGSLVKTFLHKIVKDSGADGVLCGSCGSQYSREVRIRGLPARKMIGGKVFTRRG
eukprot:m.203391 g.203391  ORF g.203391 m.203391 type:complete len:79 (-) comp25273_c0_seq3:1254-1490(-)